MKSIGIDLGLRYSVVAVRDGPQPRILENREVRAKTRSAVGLKKIRGRTLAAKNVERVFLVGEDAMYNWPLAPQDTILSVKRLIGRAVSDPEVERVKNSVLYSIAEPSDGSRDSVRLLIGGKEYSPIDISGMILRKLKEDATFRLNDEVAHAVIAIPAYFDRAQRDATREAGIKAGFTGITLVDEPTAAAISFGLATEDGTPKMLLVLDLGDETLDISLLLVAGNTFAPFHIEGDMWFGFDSFDEPLIDHVVAYVKREYDIDPASEMRFMAELKKAAQKTKENLGSNRKVALVVAAALQDSSGELIDIEMEITREVYERMIADLVDRTVSYAKKALVRSNTTPDQIDYVLMVGGSTDVPLLKKAMEELFGANKVMESVHSKYGVALGAAIVADCFTSRGVPSVLAVESAEEINRHESGPMRGVGAELCAGCGAPLDRCIRTSGKCVWPATSPFHYGIAVADGSLYALVSKGDAYPTQKPGRTDVVIRESGQRAVFITLYGGDDLRLASANERQGEARISLPPGLASRSSVTFKLGLDSDGIFEPHAELADGAHLPCWVWCGEGDLLGPEYWQTEGVVAIAAFVVREFTWALNEDQLYSVNKTAARRDTLNSFEQAIYVGDTHSTCVWLYIGRRVVETFIQPRSRLTATYLTTRLVEIEIDFRVGRPCAQANLWSLIGELAECMSILDFPVNQRCIN
ncbi:MAG: Hsp70 family protein [Planctomycetota bacterium]|nr:Hsp70 family protein [Planctomycetota bacterium]